MVGCTREKEGKGGRGRKRRSEVQREGRGKLFPPFKNDSKGPS